ncbi:polyphosphate--glucose phosphotransferase [uncultured Croceitalea sp.]|uniref:polyphosphate--glucose phosphotransferase n=1 Tax=uncultured Croceitalea sp. TaxID=1798908 RepID=UPI0033068F2A
MEILGIDVGGSGMKAALVNTETGEMLSKRHRIPTPKSRTPEAMAEVIAQLVKHFDYSGPVGCGFPTVIKNGICKSAGNLDDSWVGVDVNKLFEDATGQQFSVVNDADAAGYAVINHGIGKDLEGFVLIITIGTGLGSGAFVNGELLPNFELGQIPYKKYKKIETWAAGSAMEREELSYQKWAKRFNKFLNIVDLIVAPDHIILGGGASKDWDQYKDCIDVDTPVIAAQLKNHAGIIGAAMAGSKIKVTD